MQQYGAGWACSVFCQHFLEHLDVEGLVSDQSLEAIVLVFKLFEVPCLGDVHAAEFGVLLAKRSIRDAVLAA